MPNIPSPPPSTQIAVFGNGCFWCTETLFSRLQGVISVKPGYAGGTTSDPSYEEVSSGKTGHAEVIEVVFDPAQISYEQLVDVFFHTHNPTTPNQQGADHGTQYRSIILTTTAEQAEQASRGLEAYNSEKVYEVPAVTQIQPLDTFYPAENYHQDYYQKHQDAPYCQIVINPKLKKFKDRYATWLKA